MYVWSSLWQFLNKKPSKEVAGSRFGRGNTPNESPTEGIPRKTTFLGDPPHGRRPKLYPSPHSLKTENIEFIEAPEKCAHASFGGLPTRRRCRRPSDTFRSAYAQPRGRGVTKKSLAQERFSTCYTSVTAANTTPRRRDGSARRPTTSATRRDSWLRVRSLPAAEHRR